MESSDDEGDEVVDTAKQELEWAIHAKNHSRSRLALRVFAKIIQEDDATRDDIVYPAYRHKFQLELEFLTFPAARETAKQMITRFHGMHEPYLLKSQADSKLYKLEDALTSAFVGLGYNPIHTALISELNITRKRLCRTVTTTSVKRGGESSMEPPPPYSTEVVNVPDLFSRLHGQRTVPSRFELCEGVSHDLLQRMFALEPHATQLLVGRNIELAPELTQSASLASRMSNLADICIPIAFLRGFYETTPQENRSLFDRDCGIILSRAVRKLESAPVEPRSVLIFDVDDTAVTSYWYMKQRGFKSIPSMEFYYYSRYNAPVIPLLLKFYTYLKWKQIKVIFLSERPEMVRDHTLSMLQSAGYAVESDELYLRSPQEQMLSVAVLKQRMRTKLHKAQYKIVGSIGDQFCDIAGEHAGAPFKIPNYMYLVE